MFEMTNLRQTSAWQPNDETAASFLPLVHDQLVTIGVAKLCHPANRCLGFRNVERDITRFQSFDRGVHIIDFKCDCCSIARRLPSRMTADTDGSVTEIILDPRPSHLASGRLQFQCFLIKFACALGVRNCNSNESYFFNHKQGSFSFSGFNLWITMLLPSGSPMIAIWQHGLSNGLVVKGTFRSFK